MATLFAFRAIHTRMATAMFTLTTCPLMYRYRDRRSASTNEESQKRSASNTKSTQTETYYASIISTMLEYFAAAK